MIGALAAACGSSSPGTPPDAGIEASTDSGADAAAPTCGSIDSFVPDWVKNAAPTQEVYVAPSGNDQNDGSAQSPLATAAKAFSMLGPGVRLNFKTGTYACPPPVVDVLATTATPMIVRAVDGPRTAKFDCGGNGDFYFSHVRAVIVDGVEIANASGHGVQLDSGSGFATKDLSSDFALMNSYVHDTQLAGIKVAQSQRIYVIGDELAHIGPMRQCAEFVASDMPVIVGNDAHDADAFDEVKGGAHGGIIALNKVHDMNAGGGASSSAATAPASSTSSTRASTSKPKIWWFGPTSSPARTASRSASSAATTAPSRTTRTGRLRRKPFCA